MQKPSRARAGRCSDPRDSANLVGSLRRRNLPTHCRPHRAGTGPRFPRRTGVGAHSSGYPWTRESASAIVSAFGRGKRGQFAHCPGGRKNMSEDQLFVAACVCDRSELTQGGLDIASRPR